MPDPREDLQKLFRDFPGIGPRQASRFVDFLVRRSPAFRRQLAERIERVGDNLRICEESRQRFYDPDPNITKSPIARDTTRDRSIILIVAKERDLETVEKTGLYHGTYFVLGGLAPIVDDTVHKYIDTQELVAVVRRRAEMGELQEIIFGLPVNAEGDHTRLILMNMLEPITEKYTIKSSTLGRGLSTGTELEYSDSDTLRSALEGRN